MTATPNQPNRGTQGNPSSASRTGSPGTSQQDPQAQSKQGQSRDEGTRFGAAALQQAFAGGEDATRCLDAIQENVNKLRIAMGSSGRSGVSERESRSGRSDRSDRQSASSDEERSESSGNL